MFFESNCQGRLACPGPPGKPVVICCFWTESKKSIDRLWNESNRNLFQWIVQH